MTDPILNGKRVLVVARRVVRQLKRDRRTIGLITFLPIFLMILFGYALSGEMSGINLGIVDYGGQDDLKDHLASVDDFALLFLGSESDAERLIVEGRLHGAVVIGEEGDEVRVLLDGLLFASVCIVSFSCFLYSLLHQQSINSFVYQILAFHHIF